MKKVSSVVWQFFDRLEENKRCVAVLCKLCDTEYKYFGNTTNLRAHLIKKHPLQWEFRQHNLDAQKGLEEQPVIRAYEEDESTNTNNASPKRRSKYVQIIHNKNVEGTENSETEVDHIEIDEDTATLNLVRQMHDNQGSDEEWLEEDYVQLDMYEPSHKRPSRKIKREVVTPTPLSSTLKYVPNRSGKAKKPERIIIEEPQRDEFSVFGEYVANKLRKFKTSRTQGNIQQLITTILWQAEYGLYNDAESVKRVFISSMQNNNEVEESSVIPDQDTVMQAPPEIFKPQSEDLDMPTME